MQDVIESKGAFSALNHGVGVLSVGASTQKSILECQERMVKLKNNMATVLEREDSGCTCPIAGEVYMLFYSLNLKTIEKVEYKNEGTDDETSNVLDCTVLTGTKIKGDPLSFIDSFIRKERGHKLDGPGCIYLVSDGTYTKIGGTSYAVQKRLNELQTGNRLKLKIIDYYPVKFKISTEAMLHAKYAGKNVLGEWFNLSQQDISEILSSKQQVTHARKYTELSDEDAAMIADRFMECEKRLKDRLYKKQGRAEVKAQQIKSEHDKLVKRLHRLVPA